MHACKDRPAPHGWMPRSARRFLQAAEGLDLAMFDSLRGLRILRTQKLCLTLIAMRKSSSLCLFGLTTRTGCSAMD